jgi:hypothetical protein
VESISMSSEEYSVIITFLFLAICYYCYIAKVLDIWVRNIAVRINENSPCIFSTDSADKIFRNSNIKISRRYTDSRLLFKTQHLRDWILSPPSGATCSLNSGTRD